MPGIIGQFSLQCTGWPKKILTKCKKIFDEGGRKIATIPSCFAVLRYLSCKFLFTQRAAAPFPFLGAFLAGGFLPMTAFTGARLTILKSICAFYSLYAAAESMCMNLFRTKKCKNFFRSPSMLYITSTE